jgi:hypothetical protein
MEGIIVYRTVRGYIDDAVGFLLVSRFNSLFIGFLLCAPLDFIYQLLTYGPNIYHPYSGQHPNAAIVVARLATESARHLEQSERRERNIHPSSIIFDGNSWVRSEYRADSDASRATVSHHQIIGDVIGATDIRHNS